MTAGVLVDKVEVRALHAAGGEGTIDVQQLLDGNFKLPRQALLPAGVLAGFEVGSLAADSGAPGPVRCPPEPITEAS